MTLLALATTAPRFPITGDWREDAFAQFGMTREEWDRSQAEHAWKVETARQTALAAELAERADMWGIS